MNQLRNQRDEDGYCAICGDGKWESHFPECVMSNAADEIERLREQILALEGRLEASRDFCDLYRVAICEAIRILENPYLTNGGTSKAYGLLKKAIGQ